MAWLIQFYKDWGALIRIVAVILIAMLIRFGLSFSVRRFVRSVTEAANRHDDSPLAQARLVQREPKPSLLTWGLGLLVVSMVLSELGIAVGALIAGAGILGAAIGFGAQSLVRDLISGLFIVFEDQFGVGDSVDLGQVSGVVESVGLRVTQVRDLEGTLWFVRNGEIVRVGNQSQGWSRIVLDVALAADVDVAHAQSVLANAAAKLGRDESIAAHLIGTAEVWGINAISGEQVVVRLVNKVQPTHKDLAARELRRLVKAELDAAGIALAAGGTNIFVNLRD
jgi:moderate conductance mechanosensitive channel